MQMHPDSRLAGALVPIFALRRADDLGVGDVAALREFIDWAAEHGLKVVQLLPINETGPDNSPYNAISASALDPVTLDLRPGAVRDLSQKDYDEVLGGYDLAMLRLGSVNYPQVKALKQQLLERAFRRFATQILAKARSRSKGFRTFCAEQAEWLEGYVLFRALAERHGSIQWDQWPAEHRTVEGAQRWLAQLSYDARIAFQRRTRFFAYVQWIAFQQWREVRAYSEKRGVALMGDVPFGVSYYSADAYADRALFDLTWSGGAPPEKVFAADPFTEKWGQNWGIPLYDWPALRAQKFAWWRRRVRSVREIFHLFRIDHVLGCYRIYAFPWRPQENENYLPLSPEAAAERTGGRLPQFMMQDDLTPENAAKNEAQGEEILRVLIEEAGRFRLVGEDLGTVADYVRPHLAKLEIAGFKVPQWEVDEETHALFPGASYERLSVATYATHDHAPLKTHWDSLLERIQIGDAPTRDRAWLEMRQLADFAKMPLYSPVAYTDLVREALLRALFESNSWLAMVMITDLLVRDQRFNVPGAIADSNWSARIDETVAEWRADAWLHQRMERLRELIKASGR